MKQKNTTNIISYLWGIFDSVTLLLALVVVVMEFNAFFSSFFDSLNFTNLSSSNLITLSIYIVTFSLPLSSYILLRPNRFTLLVSFLQTPFRIVIGFSSLPIYNIYWLGDSTFLPPLLMLGVEGVKLLSLLLWHIRVIKKSDVKTEYQFLKEHIFTLKVVCSVFILSQLIKLIGVLFFIQPEQVIKHLVIIFCSSLFAIFILGGKKIVVNIFCIMAISLNVQILARLAINDSLQHFSLIPSFLLLSIGTSIYLIIASLVLLKKVNFSIQADEQCIKEII